jgi:hypothetical protein
MKKAFFSLILGACSVAHADFYTGNDLLERLNDPSRVSISMGYIAGVSDMGAGEYHCAPGEVTLGQVRDMVHRSLTSTPSTRHMSAAVLVTLTLMEAWPCPKKKGKNL